MGHRWICKGDVLGVIAFDAETIRYFSEREKKLFQVISSQIALAGLSMKLNVLDVIEFNVLNFLRHK